jgi:hypothetical protein
MTIEKQFICECGKIFASSQSCNGHKANCKEHHIAKYGTIDRIEAKNKKLIALSAQVADAASKQRQAKIDTELKAWQDVQHACERCGKTMINKYGSGRFCSKACACAHSKSPETRAKISGSLQGKSFPRILPPIKATNKAIYELSPKRCKICGKAIEYDRRRYFTCTSEVCHNKYLSIQTKGVSGGVRLGTFLGKQGWYKGYHCDSTYELAYVIYNLDHNIYFERNTTGYPYEVAGEQHLYYPDFRLADGSLVEIKGRITDIVYIKLDAVKDVPIKLLSKDDLQYAFDYVKDTYKCKCLEDLYE